MWTRRLSVMPSLERNFHALFSSGRKKLSPGEKRPRAQYSENNFPSHTAIVILPYLTEYLEYWDKQYSI